MSTGDVEIENITVEICRKKRRALERKSTPVRRVEESVRTTEICVVSDLDQQWLLLEGC